MRHDSILACILYLTALLVGLKMFGIISVSWAVVTAPVWVLGVFSVLVITVAVIVIGALTQ